jgi:acetoin utilization protein AcuB
MGIRSVEHYMTRGPLSVVDPTATLAQAQLRMRERRVRHLPVLEEGVLQGVLSLRDIHLMETLQGVDPAEVSVSEAMRADVLRVPPAAGLEGVVAHMWRDKRGAVVVMEREQLLGIFTTSDALRALLELLAEQRADVGAGLSAP